MTDLERLEELMAEWYGDKSPWARNAAGYRAKKVSGQIDVEVIFDDDGNFLMARQWRN